MGYNADKKSIVRGGCQMVKYSELWVKYEDAEDKRYLKPIAKEELFDILSDLKRDKQEPPEPKNYAQDAL